MKNFFMLLFFTLSVPVLPVTYYIDPSGSDSNDGSAAYPWLSLSNACLKARKIGDIIHVNPGTYNEMSTSNLALGVSIEGEGVSSNIIFHYNMTASPSILLHSSVEGTNGDQEISNLKLDGNNLTAWSAIMINARSNVSIHDLTVVNFRTYGVVYNGGVSYLTAPPKIYAKGNSFYNNTVLNCSIYENGNGEGALKIGGQEGMTIYNNRLIQTQREEGINGYLIKFYSNGYNKGLKIYNNYIEKAPYDGFTWPICMELWYSQGGIEIYSNEIIGCLDLANSYKGNYDYSIFVHDNIIGPEAMRPRMEIGIAFEGETQGSIVSNNYIRNNYTGISFSVKQPGKNVKDISLYNNIINGVGIVGASGGWGLTWNIDQVTTVVSNVNIWNNVFYAGEKEGIGKRGIRAPTGGNVSNVSIINNIIVGFSAYAIEVINTIPCSFDKCRIENNIKFANGNNNINRYAFIPTNLTDQKNIIADPLFLNPGVDFHLQEKSPGLDAGKYVGLPFSGLLPDIGAFESSKGELQLNKPPSISIGSPNKSESLTAPATLYIEVEASDLDGSVSKVELFNGSVKLDEKATAPYLFTLKDLAAGNYSFKAIATDNLYTATSSSVLEFQIIAFTDKREYFNLYPNPNDGRFSIDFTYSLESENYTITVVTLSGRTVYQKYLSNEVDAKKLDLSHLDRGTYIVMIKSNYIIATQKFMKS